jgi:hypothetical protein
MLATVLALVLAIAPAGVPPSAPLAVARVPGEPDAVMLPEVGTYQAVVADVDGDGVRDLLRLVAAERGAIDVEAWTLRGDRWVRLGAALNVVPVRPTGAQGNIVFAGAPVRLLVRSIGELERATLVRQPRFEEPGLDADCCLLIDDVRLVDGALALVRVADRGPSADAVLALDLDGDGTDELLASRGLPPLGDTTFPTAARVYRWSGERFAAPVFTDLAVGSGVSPFVLGDSDGAPGEEAAFIGAQSRLHRISLRAGDALVAEDGGPSVDAALAVPVEGGVGVAIVSRLTGLAVHRWPRDGALDAGFPSFTVDAGELLGVVRMQGADRLLLRDAAVEALHVLSLPTLAEIGNPTVTRSPAAGTLAASPTRPYVGPLPGGGADGAGAVVYAGRLLPSVDRPGAPFATLDSALLSTLAGAQPAGLLGPDRAWLGLHHAPLALPVVDPAGGRLDGPVLQPGSGVSLVPLETAREPELDDAILDPPVSGAVEAGRELLVPATGFTARLEAPPGSRVVLAGLDPTVLADVRVVPASGRLRVQIVPPRGTVPAARYRATVAVTTPAGRGYLAAWDVRVLAAPPLLEAAAATPFGSASVTVEGRTAPRAVVTVAGQPTRVGPDGRFSAPVPAPPWPTEVVVVATDPVGNQARVTVTGVGWFDYRGLPWAAIALGVVGAAGVVLFLRVPRQAAGVRRQDDDGVLEELDPSEDPPER